MFERGWTGLFPERIGEEIHDLQQRYAFDDLAFQDETFFTHAARVDALAEQFLRRRLRLTWTATLRADQACRLGDELFAKAVRSGLRRVMVGVESGSQAMLDRLQKDMKLDQVRIAAEMCTRHGVGAIFNFIVGFPGESPESMQATLALAKSLRRSNPAFETPIFYYRPYPGNPMATQSAAQGYVFPNGLEAWADFDYVAGRGPWITAEQWRTVERFKFYTRHAWKPGAWRWPLRATAQWRCDHDWYCDAGQKMIVDSFARPAGCHRWICCWPRLHAGADAEEQRIMLPLRLGVRNCRRTEGAGFDVGVFDGTFRSMEAFADTIQPRAGRGCRPRVKLMTKRNALAMMAIGPQARRPRRHRRSDPRITRPSYLDAGADVVVIGEGERTSSS